MMKTLLQLTLLTGVALGSLAVPSFAMEGKGLLDKDRFILRARAIDIIADGDGVVAGPNLGTDVDNAITAELDLTYFLTNNIALELIAATAEHTVSAAGTDVGDVWVLPPTLTLQYHFMPEEKFSPYIGAGLNYTLFYGEDEKNGFTDMDVDGGIGLAAQAGFDYWINDNWGFNADVKYIDLDVDVKVNGGALRANDVDLDPWVVGIGVSYRF